MDEISRKPAVLAVEAALRAAGVTPRVRVLPDTAPTAAAAAEQLGCPVAAIANSLVFDAEGTPLLVLTSGAHQVDTGKVAAHLGLAKLSRATAAFVRAHTGQPIGGVAPLGHPTPIRTLIDETLADHAEIWAAAGHPHTVFPTTFRELTAATGAEAVAVN
ncbi:prolyl-tRNA editing enzyme YbaK/EbsC (Cys-tRNA(Pro) deacylase) [Nocardia tenerifensis]|uniref:Prolyl-tRNA editing enzyme YbaK/EbsC (Cys-tRNA(Pro) deacylase) n=1 Tax=Nocardia tenerifensis TaxID=228006 RepID=A0A318JPY6_9NOCA|nr:YbaK/EbsC family protein [Nocardia tenerifensis]PXX57795.1 prolyl-tRNA editing enzyme YbaK/EbsC (Cys-tRNA(Pro) deacylase) [Nocardia tenerifensis]